MSTHVHKRIAQMQVRHSMRAHTHTQRHTHHTLCTHTERATGRELAKFKKPVKHGTVLADVDWERREGGQLLAPV